MMNWNMLYHWISCSRPARLFRWVYNKGVILPQIVEMPFIARMFVPFYSKFVNKQSVGQGMGRHTEAEVIEIGLKDLRSLSNYLGTRFIGTVPLYSLLLLLTVSLQAKKFISQVIKPQKLIVPYLVCWLRLFGTLLFRLSLLSSNF